MFNTDTVYARTSGLLGEKWVEIAPGHLKKGMTLTNLNDQIIYAQDTGSVDDCFKEFSKLSCKIDTALNSLISVLKEIKDKETIKKINSTLDSTNLFLTRLNSKWGCIDDTLTQINQTTCNLNTLSCHVTRGEGCLGKLFCGDELYLRTSSIMSKAETIMDDINHWGLLFHLDKGWQRLRARRMNLLTKLRTPQEFRNFFNDEVNQISTSLSRVSMVFGQNLDLPMRRSVD